MADTGGMAVNFVSGARLWAPFRALQDVVYTAIYKREPGSIHDLELALRKHKPDFISLLKVPSQNATARQLVTKATTEGLQIQGMTTKQQFSQQFVSEALILSDLFNMDELAAVELLMAAVSFLPRVAQRNKSRMDVAAATTTATTTTAPASSSSTSTTTATTRAASTIPPVKSVFKVHPGRAWGHIAPPSTTPGVLPDGRDVAIRLASLPEIRDVYAMIEGAAQHGDGYGVDEFPTEAFFQEEVRTGNGRAFLICPVDSPTGKPVAAFVVLDSRYFRGQGTVADSYIIVEYEERRKGIGRYCLEQATVMAAKMGYLGIYSDVFADNERMRKSMVPCGFKEVGLLPVSCRAADGTFKESIIFFRDLSKDANPSDLGKEVMPSS